MKGDFTPGKTVVVRFNTHKADGTPITLAGTPAISVYKNSTTESTSGVSLTVDYDSRTGLHSVVVDTSADGTFYAAGNDFDLVITAGTVDSISVVGTKVGEFSLSNRAALRPTTADRTLDVSAGGEAGLDWANVGSPTTSLNLSGTTVAAVTTVNGLAANVITAASAASDFGAEIQALITGGAYTLSTDANGRIRIVDGTGTGEINTNAGAIALVDLVTDITTKTGFRLSATGVDDIWDEPMAAHTTADTPGSVLNMLTQDTVTLSTDVALGSIIGQLLDAGTSWSYDRTTDSLEALRERGDAAWITNTDASIRSAVGLTSANLDAQLDALPTANEVRNAVTGGAYALNTDSNGSIRIVDGTGTGELDTLSGTVLLRSATEAAIAAILDDTGTSGVVLTSAERNSVADALLDRTSGVESGVTPRQAFRGMSAILAGIISGAGTGTEVFKGIGQASGGTTRVTVTVDSSGNRSAMSLNL